MAETIDILMLGRRNVLAIMGASAASLLVGCRSSSSDSDAAGPSDPLCELKPRQTEGPYFIDELLDRSDIRSDPTDGSVSDGTQFDLTVQISRIDGSSCTPLASAVVDIWQCDAFGVYSDVLDFNGQFDTRGKKFLRGFQLTDAAGLAQFITIYPGWYSGRTVHIHFKIRTNPGTPNGSEFTSQLYFPDALTDQVLLQNPYAARGPRDTTNDMDGIFQNGGNRLTLQPNATAQGYAATLVLGVR